MINAWKKILARLDLKKPTALGWGEWEDWHADTKKARPMAYFLMETIPDTADTAWRKISKPFNDARNAVRVRLMDRYHVINTGLKPGYHGGDTRMLHGMFNLLVDHVEIDKASIRVAFSEKNQEQYPFPWWAKGPLRYWRWRCPRAGIDYLRWEMTLDDPNLAAHASSPHQAEAAREIWFLYHWWKHARPQRPDPHDVSGWSEWCKTHSMRDMFNNRADRDPDQDRLQREILDASRDLEQRYDDEDQEMLIRLVKIRKSLWT